MEKQLGGSHEQKLQHQFGLRAPIFNGSARWITDPRLADSLVKAAGNPGQGLALCCGTGVMGRILTDAGWKMTGVDITHEMVEESSKFFPAIQASVEALPFPAGSFDLAIMRQAYFLLGNGPQALHEIRRSLKPAGRFVLAQTVPFSETDTPWLRKIHETKQKEMTRFFTAEDLENELRAHGFVVESKSFLRVRESVSLWMANAPEMEPARRQKVRELVVNAPPEYAALHQVSVAEGEILEDWNWVILTARPRQGEA